MDLKSHEEEVNRLKKQNDDLRFGSELHLTEEEKKVEEFIKTLVTDEIKRSKNAAFSRPFHEFQWDIERNSEVFKMVQMFPKGADLHAHLEAMFNFPFIIQKYTYLNNCYIFHPPNGKVPEKAQGSYFGVIDGQISFFPTDKDPNFPIPDYYRSIPSLREKAQDKYLFDQKLIESVRVNRKNIKETPNDITARWAKFEKCFIRIANLIGYQPFYEEIIEDLVKRLIRDGIYYLETRMIIGTIYDFRKNEKGEYFKYDYSEEEHIKELERINKKLKEKYKEWIGFKIISCAIRNKEKEGLQIKMKNHLLFENKYKNFIIGFDFVGLEDYGVKISEFLEDIYLMKNEAKKTNQNFTFFFHGGETNRSDIGDNLVDIAVLKPKRIGHGFYLNRYQSLYPIFKDNDICIEVSPLSNQILGLITNLSHHPMVDYLHSKLPVVISSDDPGLWGSEGLSHEFNVALMCWNLGLLGIKKLALNSIEYSITTPEEKKKFQSLWNEKYDIFIKKALQAKEKYVKAQQKQI